MNEINVTLTNADIENLLKALSIADHECLMAESVIDDLSVKLDLAKERNNI